MQAWKKPGANLRYVLGSVKIKSKSLNSIAISIE